MPIVSWTDAIWPVVNGDSGLWINDVWYNCPIKRYDEDKYYIGIQDTSYKEAKEGDEVVFKGKYSYDGYIVEFSEVHLTFDGTKWEYVKEVVDGKLTIADAEIQGGGSPSAIYLSGYDTLMHEIEWRVRLDSKSDNNNGILLNGEKMSGGLKKYNKTRYYAEFSEAASVGDIVTIKGEFGNETTNQYINIRETKLRWNGSLWEEVIDNPDESGCEFSAIGLVYNNATQLQLIGNDTHPMTDWTVNFVAAYGDDNGVLFNGVKTDIPMKRIGNSEKQLCIRMV